MTTSILRPGVKVARTGYPYADRESVASGACSRVKAPRLGAGRLTEMFVTTTVPAGPSHRRSWAYAETPVMRGQVGYGTRQPHEIDAAPSTRPLTTAASGIAGRVSMSATSRLRPRVRDHRAVRQACIESARGARPAGIASRSRAACCSTLERRNPGPQSPPLPRASRSIHT